MANLVFKDMIKRYPSSFVYALVREELSIDDKRIKCAHIFKQFSILVHNALAMPTHNLFSNGIIPTDFSIDVTNEDDKVSGWKFV